MAEKVAALGLGLPVTGTFAVPLMITSSFSRSMSSRIALRRQNHLKDGKEAAGIKQPDGNTYDPLLMATRLHANLIENMPITLILAGLAELNGADRKRLTGVLAAFTLIRISHVVGLTQASQPFRAVGYFGTQFVQLGLTGWLALLVKGYWGF